MKPILVILLLAALPALAQPHHGPAQQPYRGEQARGIKALSAEEMEQYRSGAGMGFAKPAELNRFPGPMHALELAEKLGLDERQQRAMRQLMDAHKAEAKAIGAKLVTSEAALDALFRSGTVETSALSRAVRDAGALQAEYRLSHLETHRQARMLLTDAQVERYQVLRGYQTVQATPDHTQHHALADGEVRRVDRDARKITLRHGPIVNLDMPAMTMVFQVRDPALLDKVKVGDKVKFEAAKDEGGAYVVKSIELAK